MTLFEAAAQLGSLPSGVILGLIWGVLSLPQIRCPKWARFPGDVFAVLMFSFCLFMLGVGIEGHLRYPTVTGAAIGFIAVRALRHVFHKYPDTAEKK